MLAKWSFGLIASVFSMVVVFQSGCDLPWLSPAPVPGITVNIQVDAENDDVSGLTKIMDELEARGIHTTIYVTADYVNQGNAQLIRDLYQDGHEIALHGYSTGEMLTSMTYEQQLDLLTRAKTAVEGCRPCGMYKPVTGFRPQYFSQNADTYKVLETLSISYNSGFKAGLLAIEGHEEDLAPYAVTGEGYDFTAVPFTTVASADKEYYLCDIASAQSELLTGQQWSHLLQTAVDEAVANDQPLTVLFHGWYTGSEEHTDYWQAFTDLLDRLQEERAVFVNTTQLVEAYDAQ